MGRLIIAEGPYGSAKQKLALRKTMIIYEEILRDFNKKKVKYIIVGGLAYNLLGGYRNTLDLDIVVDMTDKNLSNIIGILKKHGYSVKQPVDPMGIADRKLREDWIKNKNMKAFNFYKSHKTYQEVDIVIDSPIDYKKAIKNALRIKVKGLNLLIISPTDFVRMKKASGRDKDLRDIEDIKIVRNMK